MPGMTAAMRKEVTEIVDERIKASILSRLAAIDDRLDKIEKRLEGVELASGTIQNEIAKFGTQIGDAVKAITVAGEANVKSLIDAWTLKGG